MFCCKYEQKQLTNQGKLEEGKSEDKLIIFGFSYPNLKLIFIIIYSENIGVFAKGNYTNGIRTGTLEFMIDVNPEKVLIQKNKVLLLI